MNKMGSKVGKADTELLQAQCVIQHLLCRIARLEKENERLCDFKARVLAGQKLHLSPREAGRGLKCKALP